MHPNVLREGSQKDADGGGGSSRIPLGHAIDSAGRGGSRGGGGGGNGSELGLSRGWVGVGGLVPSPNHNPPSCVPITGCQENEAKRIRAQFSRGLHPFLLGPQPKKTVAATAARGIEYRTDGAICGWKAAPQRHKVIGFCLCPLRLAPVLPPPRPASPRTAAVYLHPSPHLTLPPPTGHPLHPTSAPRPTSLCLWPDPPCFTLALPSPAPSRPTPLVSLYLRPPPHPTSLFCSSTLLRPA